jgi:hypothetical protein
MDIRPSLQIQVMIKAMEQVVLPAVDPVNKIAHEQTGLVLATLRFLEQRLPLWRPYLRDEIKRLVKLLDSIMALDGGDSAVRASLAKLAEKGRALLERADAEAPTLEKIAIDIRNAVGRLMAEYEALGSVHRTPLGRLVLDAAAQQLDRERAWLIPFGFEGEATGIVPIDQQLDTTT